MSWRCRWDRARCKKIVGTCSFAGWTMMKLWNHTVGGILKPCWEVHYTGCWWMLMIWPTFAEVDGQLGRWRWWSGPQGAALGSLKAQVCLLSCLGVRLSVQTWSLTLGVKQFLDCIALPASISEPGARLCATKAHGKHRIACRDPFPRWIIDRFSEACWKVFRRLCLCIKGSGSRRFADFAGNQRLNI